MDNKYAFDSMYNSFTSNYPIIVEKTEDDLIYIQYFILDKILYKRTSNILDDNWVNRPVGLIKMGVDECLEFINKNMDSISMDDIQDIKVIKRNICLKMLI